MIHARKLIRLRERSNNFCSIKVCRTTSLTQTLSPRRGLSRSPRFENISDGIWSDDLSNISRCNAGCSLLLGERAGVREDETRGAARNYFNFSTTSISSAPSRPSYLISGHANRGRCCLDDFVQRFLFRRCGGVRFEIVNAQKSVLVCVIIRFHYWFQFIRKNSRPA